jgi:hypothetical protein
MRLGLVAHTDRRLIVGLVTLVIAVAVIPVGPAAAVLTAAVVAAALLVAAVPVAVVLRRILRLTGAVVFVVRAERRRCALDAGVLMSA